MKSNLFILSALFLASYTQAATFNLETSQEEPLYQTTLPKAVYQYSKTDDLQDLTVMNAENEAVPHALVPYNRMHPEQIITEKSKPIVIFPMQQDSNNHVAITAIQLDNHDSKTSIQMTSKTGATNRYYLFDLGRQHPPFNKLTLDWDGPLGKLLTLDVLSSNNLKDWQHVGEGTLLKVTADNETILKNSISFIQEINAQFLQIKPKNTTENFLLKSASLQFSTFEDAPLPIDWQTIPLTLREQTNDFTNIDFESPSRYPVGYLNVQLPQQNTITYVSVYVRNDKNSTWRILKSTSLYNLNKEGKQYTNKPIQIPNTTARYWRLRFSNKNGGIGNKNPELSLGWLAQTLIWNARGLGPYNLQVGEEKVSKSTMNVNDLLKPYGNQNLRELPSAPLRLASSSQHFNAWETARDTKSIWLWAVLILGVIVVTGMASSLLKSTSKE